MKRVLAVIGLAAAVARADGIDATIELKVAELRGEDAGRRQAALDVLAGIGERAIPALSGFASDEDWHMRRDIAATLAKIRADGAQPVLETLSRDVVWNVREAAARGLRPGTALDDACRDPIWRVRSAAASRAEGATLDLLIEDREPAVRRNAALGIVARADPRFHGQMAALLLAPDLRDAGFALFARIGGPDDAALLKPLFDDPDPSLCAGALRAAYDRKFDVVAPVGRYLARMEGLKDVSPGPDAERFAAMLAGLSTLGPAAFDAIARRIALPECTMTLEYCGAIALQADPLATGAYQAMLKHADGNIRYLGLDALARLNSPVLEESAAPLLDDPFSEVRTLSVSVLGRSPQGCAVLRKAWGTLTGGARPAAAAILGGTTSPETEALMETLLEDKDDMVRASAHGYFLKRRLPGYLQKVLGWYRKESSSSIRSQMLSTLSGQIEAYVDVFAAAANDESMSIRAVAIGGLGRLRGSSHTDTLRRACNDADPRIRATALAGLDARLSASAWEVFAEATQDSEEFVRQVAVRALGRRPGASTAIPLAIAMDDPSPSIRMMAIEGIGEFPEGIAIHLLKNALMNDEDPLVRSTAARVSARFSSAVDVLGKLAKAEQSTEARAAIIAAVAESGAGGVRDFLRQFAGDPESMVRSAVAIGMGRSPGNADIAVLAKLSGDGDFTVRLSATEALGQIPGAASTAALDAATHDAAPQVARSASFALARRGDIAAARAWLDRSEWALEDLLDIAQDLDAASQPALALDLLLERPLAAPAFSTAGWCAIQTGQFAAARSFFCRATIAGEPAQSGWDWALLAQALAAAQEGRPEAEGLIRAFVDRTAPRAASASNAAFLLADSGLLPSLAVELAREAAAPSESDPLAKVPADVLDTLGWALLSAGQVEEAERTLGSLEGPSAPIWFHRAAAHAAAGHVREAASALRRALSNQPGLRSRALADSRLSPIFTQEELQPWR